jgi:MoxR-like ATPase
MSLALLTSPDAVLAAMREFDELGRESFLAKYGYGRANAYFVEHDGHLYDSKALAGVAVGFEHPERGPLRANEFSAGDATVKPKLEELGFRVVDSSDAQPRALRAWWVNQGRTFDPERSGGYVWAPQRGEAGRIIAHHKSVAELQAGDIVLHYAKGLVRAVSVVREAGHEEARPPELPEEEWSREGYLAGVDYHDAPTPIALEEIPNDWRTEDQGPFTRHGGVKQGYLFPLSSRFVERFVDEFAPRWPGLVDLLRDFGRSLDLDEFLHWGRRFFEWRGFDRDERIYKLHIAARVRAARDAFHESGDWRAALQASFKRKDNNLLPWQVSSRLVEWADDVDSSAPDAFSALWSEREPQDRAQAFLELLPGEVVSGRGMRAAVASYFLMTDEPERFPIYRPTPFEKAYELTGFPKAPAEADEVTLYEHALEFLDLLLERAATAGIGLRDRLDAQAVVWSLTKYPLDQAPIVGWSPADQEAFARYRGDLPASIEASGLDGLAKALLLDVEYLREIEKLISDKRQVIFYGPPGTGKTYVARQLALHFAGSSERVVLVQFHPSYAYEDFVEGYRPQDLNGHPGFGLVGGPFKQLAEAALAAPQKLFALIIDEINRGNVAKVFGELYFLLEYREEAIKLQYSSSEFRLPDNLWIVGTMNTADRSIALLDAALRRRFYFVPFFPDEPPIEGLLRRWLNRHKPELEWVADVVDRANAQLGDRNVGIGPSYFMRANLSEEWVELIWKHAILPYLGEQFFGEEERLVDFELERLRFGVPAVEQEEGEEADQAS